MKIERNGEIIDVPKGSYEQDYKALGYEPVEPVENIDKLTVEELKARASEKGVEGYDKMKKGELLEALKEGE